MTDRPFNAAGSLAGFFVDSKLTPLVILAVAVFGTLALLLTPREENPQIPVPAAQVSVALPGASAQEVESLLLTPLEAALSQMPDVEHTYGTASHSLATVQVEFDVGVPRKAVLVRVYDRVEQLRARLPVQAGLPMVTSIDSTPVPARCAWATSACTISRRTASAAPTCCGKARRG